MYIYKIGFVQRKTLQFQYQFIVYNSLHISVHDSPEVGLELGDEVP